MIKLQPGFVLIALTPTGRGSDAGWPTRDNHEFEVPGQQSAWLAASPILVT
jgi:hypothetical protein